MKILEQFKKQFPRVWCKDGKEFDGGEAVLWSGEDNIMPDGMPAFDYYATSDLYEFGVHKDLVAFAEKHDLYWECYDPGTYLAYPA